MGDMCPWYMEGTNLNVLRSYKTCKGTFMQIYEACIADVGQAASSSVEVMHAGHRKLCKPEPLDIEDQTFNLTTSL